MTLPEVTIQSTESPPSRFEPVDSGTWFIAGLTERGPADQPGEARNLRQYVKDFGDRSAPYAAMYDAAESFFRTGGSKLRIARVVGPAPTKATVTIDDGAAANTMAIDAIGYGSWGASLDAIVAEGAGAGQFKITITENDVTVEQSPDLDTVADAVAWASNSNYVRIRDLGGADPVEGTYSLAGGTDDRTNAGNTQYENALNLFGKELGPGQVSLPGRTTAQAHQDLEEHAEINNRFAYLDFPDTHDVPTLKGLAASSRALDQARYGQGFAPWYVIPGIAAGTTRTVAPSAIEAGKAAKLLSLGFSPNIAVAGERGISDYPIGLSQDPWDDDDREELNDAGVTVIRFYRRAIRTYGMRTLVDPIGEPHWLLAPNARLDMEVRAKADQIGEQFMFEQIDGRGFTFANLAGRLGRMLMPYWEDGALFGETPAEAFVVDTGPQVNTPETIANREINAIIDVAYSPSGETVRIEIHKRLTTEAV